MITPVILLRDGSRRMIPSNCRIQIHSQPSPSQLVDVTHALASREIELNATRASGNRAY
jgi:hypothetical protein